MSPIASTPTCSVPSTDIHQKDSISFCRINKKDEVCAYTSRLMKSLFSIILLTFITFSGVAQESYRIEYTIRLDQQLKDFIRDTSQEEMDQHTRKRLSDYLDMEGKASIRTWVNSEMVLSKFHPVGKSTQLVDKKNNKLYLLDSVSQRYAGLPEDVQTSVIKTTILQETAEIAGINCKAAILEASNDEMNTGNMTYKVWYAENLPKVYWKDYQFLAEVPGAVLRLAVDGYTYEAIRVKKENINPEIFSIPHNYKETDVEALTLLLDPHAEDMDLGEDRIAFMESGNTLYGIKNEKNEVLAKPQFVTITPYHDDVAIATLPEDAAVLIDLNGQIIGGERYDYIDFFLHRDAYLFSKNGKTSLMNKQGKQIWPHAYDQVESSGQKYAIVMEGEQMGIIDHDGNSVVPLAPRGIDQCDQYHYISDTGNGPKVYTIVDEKLVFEGYDIILLTGEKDLFVVSKDADSFGLANKNGELILPMEYSYITPFSNGRASVMKNNAEDEYFINTKGEQILEDDTI